MQQSLQPQVQLWNSRSPFVQGLHHHHHHHHHHQSLNPEGRWGTTDDVATSFLHFSLFSTALWDLPNSRPIHSLMLSLQFASLYDRQEVFVWSGRQLDLGTDFLVGNMFFV